MNNIDPSFIKSAKSKDPEKLLNSLPTEERKKVNDILADKEKLSQLLNSPQAQAIMKMLSGKEKNG